MYLGMYSVRTSNTIDEILDNRARPNNLQLHWKEEILLYLGLQSDKSSDTLTTRVVKSLSLIIF